jgi:hypothetical protein
MMRSNVMEQYTSLLSFLEDLSYRISDWHAECNCHSSGDMTKAIYEIDALIEIEKALDNNINNNNKR